MEELTEEELALFRKFFIESLDNLNIPEPTEKGLETDLMLFIFAGEANMSGRGEPDGIEYDFKDHKVMMLNSSYNWVKSLEQVFFALLVKISRKLVSAAHFSIGHATFQPISTLEKL